MVYVPGAKIGLVASRDREEAERGEDRFRREFIHDRVPHAVAPANPVVE
jgi:hypothetical protein